MHCVKNIGRVVNLVLVDSKHGALDDQELRELNKGREGRGVRGGLVVGALRVNAKHGKEADNHAIVDIAVEWVVKESNTQEEASSVNLLIPLWVCFRGLGRFSLSSAEVCSSLEDGFKRGRLSQGQTAVED